MAKLSSKGFTLELTHDEAVTLLCLLGQQTVNATIEALRDSRHGGLLEKKIEDGAEATPIEGLYERFSELLQVRGND